MVDSWCKTIAERKYEEWPVMFAAGVKRARFCLKVSMVGFTAVTMAGGES